MHDILNLHKHACVRVLQSVASLQLQTSTVHGESELNLAVIQEEKSVVSHVESHVESRKSSIDIERASLKL